MKRLLVSAVMLVGVVKSFGASADLLMSMDDKFTVRDSEKWSVTVKRQLDLRFADVQVLPKGEKTFSLMLYFKCDTKDLAQFDSPEKMKKAVLESSTSYLSGAVEKELKVEELKSKGWYGFKVKITDASLADKKTLPEGAYRYIIRGMIRLSEDSVLGFSLMTNDPNSAESQEIEKFIYQFCKGKKKN